jgi:hypothetical protein
LQIKLKMICSDDTTPNPVKWEAIRSLINSPTEDQANLSIVAFRKRLEEFESRLMRMVREECQNLPRAMMNSGSIPGQTMLPMTLSAGQNARYNEQQTRRIQQLGSAQTLVRKLIILARQKPFDVNNYFIETELTKCGDWLWEEFKKMVTNDLEQCRMLIDDNKNSLGEFLSQQSRTANGILNAYSFAYSKDSRSHRTDTDRPGTEVRKEIASHSNNQEIDRSTSRADSELTKSQIKKIKRTVGFDRLPSLVSATNTGAGLPGAKKLKPPRYPRDAYVGLLPNSPFIKPEMENAHEAIVRIKNKFDSAQEREHSVEFLLTGNNTKQDDHPPQTELGYFGNEILVPTIEVESPQVFKASEHSKPIGVIELKGGFDDPKVCLNSSEHMYSWCSERFKSSAKNMQQKQMELQSSRKIFLRWMDGQNEQDLMREFEDSIAKSSKSGKEVPTSINALTVKKPLGGLSSKMSLKRLGVGVTSAGGAVGGRTALPESKPAAGSQGQQQVTGTPSVCELQPSQSTKLLRLPSKSFLANNPSTLGLHYDQPADRSISISSNMNKRSVVRPRLIGSISVVGGGRSNVGSIRLRTGVRPSTTAREFAVRGGSCPSSKFAGELPSGQSAAGVEDEELTTGESKQKVQVEVLVLKMSAKEQAQEGRGRSLEGWGWKYESRVSSMTEGRINPVQLMLRGDYCARTNYES